MKERESVRHQLLGGVGNLGIDYAPAYSSQAEDSCEN